MKLIAALFVTLLLTVTSKAQTCTPIQGCDIIISGNCYAHVDDNLIWNQSEDCCVAWGGHLASIHSDDANILLNDIRNKERFTWIGLSQTATFGVYVWTDGTPFDYENFHPDQPNNDAEFCFHFFNTARGELTWNDYVCNYNTWGSVLTSYICQKNLAVGPANVTLQTIDSQTIQVTICPPAQIQQNGLITNYNVSYTGDPFDRATRFQEFTDSLAFPAVMCSVFNLTGLQEYNNYTVNARANNSDGFSDLSLGQTEQTDQSASDAPLNLASENTTSTSFCVTFDPPTNITQNGQITSYTVTYQGKLFNTTEIGTTVSVNAVVYPLTESSSVCISNLVEYNNYTVLIRAVNGAGEGVAAMITVETFQSAIPEIIFPTHNISENLTNLEDFHETIECVATGVPVPEVYWIKSPDDSERIGTSSIEITSVLLTEPFNVFYCVAVNSVGMDVVTVTYHISVETALDNVKEKLDNSTSITPEAAATIVESISSSVQTSSDMKVLTTSVELIEQIVDQVNGTFDNETARIITATLDIVIQKSNDSFEEPQTEGGSIATVPTAVGVALRTLEKFSVRLLEDLLVDEDRRLNTVQSESIVIVNQVINLDTVDPENEIIKLPLETGRKYSVSLSLPLDVAKHLSMNNRRLAISTAIVMLNPANKSVTGTTYQASDILTTSIIGQNGTINLRNEVPLRFDVYAVPEEVNLVCVSLDDNSWESEGLTTEVESGVVICKTSHFTSFAVFVTPYKRETGITDKILSIFSYILVSISFISLIISLVLFIIAGKAFFKVETNIIYFNYCTSLLIATAVFLFGIEIGKFNRILCSIVAFLLHYTWLAVFTWTLCIGILIMFKLVIGVLSTRKIYPYLIVFGWIFPLIIPVITVIVTNTINGYTYVDTTTQCFLTYEGGVIWSFIAPVVIILIINVVFLVIAIIKIIYSKLNNTNNKHQVVLKDALITALLLTPVLGIPWLFLIFNISIQHVVLEFIFIFLNSIIGLIFLFVVVLRNKEVRTTCKRRSNKGSCQLATDKTGKSFPTGSVQVSDKFKKATGVNTLERADTKGVHASGIENEYSETKC